MGIRVKGAALAAALLIVAGVDGRMSAAGTAAMNALARLRAGNARFVASPQEALPVDAGRRAAATKGETPFATILSCADSRVPPEVVFHTGLGDLFVVRAAGNITDKAILASIEYSVQHLNVPLVVVMGHESCSIVKTAAETPAGQSAGPNLDYLINAIRPSVASAASRPEGERLRAAILANVEESLNDILTGSAVLRDAGKDGKVMFVGAYYELGTGKTYFSEAVTPPPAEPRSTGGHN